MKNVLLITSSPRGDLSHSSKVAHQFADQLSSVASVKARHVSPETMPQITDQFVQAIYTPEDARTDAQVQDVALSDALLSELFEAEVLVIASGMINFSIPSPLKAWIDHISRAGKTFTYSEAGVKGLLEGKKLVLVLASGGIYSEGPMAVLNHQETYLKSVFGFLGITDIESILIEGVNYGPEVAEKAVADANERASQLAAKLKDEFAVESVA